jgi:hypothetical protein
MNEEKRVNRLRKRKEEAVEKGRREKLEWEWEKLTLRDGKRKSQITSVYDLDSSSNKIH